MEKLGHDAAGERLDSLELTGVEITEAGTEPMLEPTPPAPTAPRDRAVGEASFEAASESESARCRASTTST